MRFNDLARGHIPKPDYFKKERDMNTKKNYSKGARHEIIQMLFLNGVVTYSSLCVLPCNRRMLGRAVKKMEKEGVVEILSSPKRVILKDNIRKETGEERREYLAALTDIQCRYYAEYITPRTKYLKKSLNSWKSTEVRRKTVKMFRDSEINALMYASGAMIIPGTKPMDFGLVEDEYSVYYTSREIKILATNEAEIDESMKTYAGRSHGVLISPGGIYMAYHTGNAVLRWDAFSETGSVIRAHKVLDKMVSPIAHKSFPDKISSAIVVADNPIMLSRMVTYDPMRGRWKNAIATIQTVYDSLFGIVNDVYGRKMLTLMQTEGWKSILKKAVLSHEEIEEAKFCSTPCDGYDREKNIYTMLFCIPDLIKFRMFCMRASLENNPSAYRIICFSHQMPTVANTISESSCKVLSIPFEKFMQRLGIELWEEKAKGGNVDETI